MTVDSGPGQRLVLRRTPRLSPADSPRRLSRYGSDRRAIADERQAGEALPWQPTLFLVSLVVPWVLHIGPMQLSVYRLILVAALLPCLAQWAGGKAGRIRVPDIAVLAYCLWAAVSLTAVEGAGSAFESSGMIGVETAGAYFMARCYIRGPQAFRAMVVLLFRIVLVLLPFAVAEAVMQRNILLELFSLVLPISPEPSPDLRWGLARVSSVFGHPILFGAVAGSLFALVHLVLGRGRSVLRRWSKDLLIVFATLLSLSSAPIGMVVLQMSIVAWDRLLRRFEQRWWLIFGLIAAAYLVVDVGSNQTPVQFYISHFTFDGQTGWYRLAIWDYGTASVAAHPLFGVGNGEWARPFWMTSSIDNFWLIHFVRYGIPAGVLMLAIYGSSLFAVARKTMSSERIASYRKAYLISMVGVFVVGSTVHFWGPAYVLFLFLLASGLWIADTDKDGAEAEIGQETDGAPERKGRQLVRKPLHPARAARRMDRGAPVSRDAGLRR